MLLSILSLLLNFDPLQYPDFLERNYKDGDHTAIVSQSQECKIFWPNHIFPSCGLAFSDLRTINLNYHPYIERYAIRGGGLYKNFNDRAIH